METVNEPFELTGLLSSCMAPKRKHPVKVRNEEAKRPEQSSQPDRNVVQANVLYEFDHMMVIEAEKRGNRFAGIVLRLEENIHSTPYGLSNYQFELLKDSLKSSSRQNSNPQAMSSVVYRHADRLAESARLTGEIERPGSGAEQLSYEDLLQRNSELEDLVFRLRQLRYGSRPLAVAKRHRAAMMKKVNAIKKKQKQEVPTTETGQRKGAPRNSAEETHSSEQQPEEAELQETFTRGPLIGNDEYTVPVIDSAKVVGVLRIERTVAVISSNGLADAALLQERSLNPREKPKETVVRKVNRSITNPPTPRRMAFLKANGEKLWCRTRKRRVHDPPESDTKRAREASQEKALDVLNELAPLQDVARPGATAYMKGESICIERGEEGSSIFHTSNRGDYSSMSARLSTKMIARKVCFRKSADCGAAAEEIFIANRIQTSAELLFKEVSTAWAFHDRGREIAAPALEPKSKVDRSRNADLTNDKRKNYLRANVNLGHRRSERQLQRNARREHCTDVSADRWPIRSCNSGQETSNEPLTFPATTAKASKFGISSRFSGCLKFISHSKRACQYLITLSEKNIESTSAKFREGKVKLAKSFNNQTLESAECTLSAHTVARNRLDLSVEDVRISLDLRRTSPGNPLPMFQAVKAVVPCVDSVGVSRSCSVREVVATVADDSGTSGSVPSLPSTRNFEETVELEEGVQQRPTEKEVGREHDTFSKADDKKRRLYVDGPHSLFASDAFPSGHSSIALQEDARSSGVEALMGETFQSRKSQPDKQHFQQRDEVCSTLSVIPGKDSARASLTISDSRSRIAQRFEKLPTSGSAERFFGVRYVLKNLGTCVANASVENTELNRSVHDSRSHSITANPHNVPNVHAVAASLSTWQEEAAVLSAMDGSERGNLCAVGRAVPFVDPGRPVKVCGDEGFGAKVNLRDDELEKLPAVFRNEHLSLPLEHAVFPAGNFSKEGGTVGKSLQGMSTREFTTSPYTLAADNTVAIYKSFVQEKVTVNVSFDRRVLGQQYSQFEATTYVAQACDTASVSDTLCKVDIGADLVYDERLCRTSTGFIDHLHDMPNNEPIVPIGTFLKRNALLNQGYGQPVHRKKGSASMTRPDSAFISGNVTALGGALRETCAPAAIPKQSVKREFSPASRTPSGQRSSELNENATLESLELPCDKRWKPRPTGTLSHVGVSDNLGGADPSCSRQRLPARQLDWADVPASSPCVSWQVSGDTYATRANVESAAPFFRTPVHACDDSPASENSMYTTPRVIPSSLPAQPPGWDVTAVPPGGTEQRSVLPPVEELIGTDRRLSGPKRRTPVGHDILHTVYPVKKC